MNDTSKVKAKDDEYSGIFRKFCETSTVHGTYFWHAAENFLSKSFWVVVVIIGFGTATFVINRSFKAWDLNPVITSVAQIPIEQVPFPSVTICPKGSTEFGYSERVVNERGLDPDVLGQVLVETFLLAATRTVVVQEDHCLVQVCSAANGTELDCEDSEEFRVFVESVRSGQQDYGKNLRQRLMQLLPEEFSFSDPDDRLFEITEDPSCHRVANDYLGVKESARILPHFRKESVQPGSLLKFIFSHLQDQATKNKLFERFMNSTAFPELYSSSLGTEERIPLPDLVETLSRKDLVYNDRFRTLENIKSSEELLEIMKFSYHPPHVAEVSRKGAPKRVPDPAFPFCLYQDQAREGIKYGAYNEHYCQDFQTTINEQGLCYTYNNFNLGTDIQLGDSPIKVRSVKGCGKSKGLQVIVDSQSMPTGKIEPNNFIVFITVPGVVTHKVPFMVNPKFDGEYHFHLHGIHYIDSSLDFKSWNEDALVCYYPNNRNLDYFSIYTQDNCLLECRYKKIAEVCGCAPWYLNQSDYSICGVEGNNCFEEMFKNYQEDLQDRVDCDCRSDCEGIHFFASMNRYPFTDKTATDQELWWNKADRGGRLANYLLDPMNVFVDAMTKNATKLLHNLTDLEYADKRFKEDISVLNFFFDTPIITRITLEMRISVFDQISAIGGTLGLFTGISLITFVELLYWGLQVMFVGMKKASTGKTSPVAVLPIGQSESTRVRSHYGKSYPAIGYGY